MGTSQKLLEQMMELKFSAKSLQRQVQRCEKEENAFKLKVKQSIEKRNMDGARTYAQSAIRKKAEQMSYLELANRLEAAIERLEALAQSAAPSRPLASSVKAIDSAVTSLNLRKVSEAMEVFEKHLDEMETQAKLMEEAQSASHGNSVDGEEYEEYEEEEDDDDEEQGSSYGRHRVSSRIQVHPSKMEALQDLARHMAELQTSP